MATKVVPIRFPKKDLKALDSFVSEGEFKSRSEMIRYAVKRTISDLYAKKIEEEILKKPGARTKTNEQILKELRSIRRGLWGKKYAKGISGL
jgi:Arc/MetJ-type ribon-helix-helix transcriptional regulator